MAKALVDKKRGKSKVKAKEEQKARKEAKRSIAKTALLLFLRYHLIEYHHPSATSKIIIITNPPITPSVPALECSPK